MKSLEPLDWLLSGDPAIRWQALRDLAPTETTVDLIRERGRVATEGWGAAILALQLPNGSWPATPPIEPVWRSTLEAMTLLREFGIDPAAPPVRTAVERLHSQFSWGEEFGNTRFFEGEVEPCINGRVLALGACFGHPNAPLLERLLSEQLEDGGWNCRAPASHRSSFHSTICVLEGLLAWEQTSSSPLSAVTGARRRAEEYLLSRRLHRSLATGQPINPDWHNPAFPTDWHYDILWALDYFRRAGHPSDDPRLAEALAILDSCRAPYGRWFSGPPHRQDLPFFMEPDVHQPSRWITLRALRVLRWAKHG